MIVPKPALLTPISTAKMTTLSHFLVPKPIFHVQNLPIRRPIFHFSAAKMTMRALQKYLKIVLGPLKNPPSTMIVARNRSDQRQFLCTTSYFTCPTPAIAWANSCQNGIATASQLPRQFQLLHYAATTYLVQFSL